MCNSSSSLYTLVYHEQALLVAATSLVIKRDIIIRSRNILDTNLPLPSTDQTEYYEPRDPHTEPHEQFVAFHLTNPNLDSLQTNLPTNHRIYELPDSPIPELEEEVSWVLQLKNPLKPWEQHIVENLDNPWEHLRNFHVHGLRPTFDINQRDLLFRLPYFIRHRWLNIHAFYYDINIEDLIH